MQSRVSLEIWRGIIIVSLCAKCLSAASAQSNASAHGEQTWAQVTESVKSRPQSGQQQRPPLIESGTFTVHNYLAPWGAETYTIRREGNSLFVKATFKSSIPGDDSAQTSTLRLSPDLTPQAFDIRGKTPAGFSTVDCSVEIRGSTALIHEYGLSRQAPLERQYFTLSGYAPVAIQMMLVRYWARHGRADRIPLLPYGKAVIERRGQDVVEAGGHPVILDRLSLDGPTWGRETLWVDSGLELVAMTTVDPLWGQFEIVRQGYETNLPLFVSLATKDRLTALAHWPTGMTHAETGALAITGGLLIDGTNRPPVADATVLIEGSRIVAVGPGSEVRIPPTAHVVDAREKTLLAGLWDMHAHYSQVEWGAVYLAVGVTTVRDCQNEIEFITSVRDAINSGQGLGPRILLAGLIDGQGPRASGIDRAGTPEEARAVVNRYKDAGYQQIKLF
jgi:hypothetical protein